MIRNFAQKSGNKVWLGIGVPVYARLGLNGTEIMAVCRPVLYNKHGKLLFVSPHLCGWNH